MIVTVYGIGNVGSTLASLLVRFEGITILNLMDPADSVAGRVLDLQHAGIWSRVDVRWNDPGLVSRSDFIFFAAGSSNAAGQNRYEVGRQNKALIQSVFEGLKVKERATVIAITNPVEQATQWISTCLQHRNQVLGTGTLLDSLRLRSILGELAGLPGHQVKAMVLGEHGENMVPIFSQVRIGGGGNLALPLEIDQEEVTRQLKGMATRIRQTEEGTRYGPAQSALAIMEALLEDRETVLPVSIRINSHYQDRFGAEEGLFMSLPCTVQRERMVIVNGLEFAPDELARLKAAAASIAANL